MARKLMQIGITFLLIILITGCVSYPSKMPYLKPDDIKTVCTQLKFRTYGQSPFSGEFIERRWIAPAFPDPIDFRYRNIFEKHGILTKCENPKGEYEVTFKSGVESFGVMNGVWILVTGLSLGIIPYRERDYKVIEIRRGESLILKEKIDFEEWASLFLTFKYLNQGFTEISRQYGSNEIMDILMSQIAGDAIKKDVESF